MPEPMCRVCKSVIVIPHCESRTCNWCRACYDRKIEEGKRAAS